MLALGRGPVSALPAMDVVDNDWVYISDPSDDLLPADQRDALTSALVEALQLAAKENSLMKQQRDKLLLSTTSTSLSPVVTLQRAARSWLNRPDRVSSARPLALMDAVRALKASQHSPLTAKQIHVRLQRLYPDAAEWTLTAVKRTCSRIHAETLQSAATR